MEGRSIVWVLHRPGLARAFDRVLVLRGGHIIEDGAPDALIEQGSIFAELAKGD